MKFRTILILSVALSSICAHAMAQEGDLEKSRKKTLFIFPIEYGRNAQGVPSARKQWIEEQFYKTFVTTFERFDFIAMPESAQFEPFLVDANSYLEEHAREVVQKRKEPDGRIGEARVTLDDLKQAVADGYVFVPVFDIVKRVKDEEDDVNFKVAAHLDIYSTVDAEKIALVTGSTESVGGLLGAFRVFADQMGIGDLTAQNKVEQAFRGSVNGVFEEIKTNVRKLDQFSLKALVTSSSMNTFTFDLGRNFGVRLDKRYKTWAISESGERTKMLGFGKVRDIGESRSTCQVLIGGASEGDQVVEDARFGINIAPMVGVVPWETDGFDVLDNALIWDPVDGDIIFELPKDETGLKLILGLSLEYNIAWLTNVSELYLVAEGGLVPVEDLFVWDAMGGLRKKFYFRRLAAWGTVKGGAISINFIDTGLFDSEKTQSEEGDDATVYGIGFDLGAEMLLTPDISLRGQVGWVGFPKQTVLLVWDWREDDIKAATVKSAGITFAFTLSFTI